MVDVANGLPLDGVLLVHNLILFPVFTGNFLDNFRLFFFVGIFADIGVGDVLKFLE